MGTACGGINYVEIPEYPSVVCHRVAASDGTRAALERQLLLVYLGRTHRSSAIHEEVIRGLDRPGSSGRAALDDLRLAAAAARVMRLRRAISRPSAPPCADCTEGQRRLHPSLIGSDAQRVIAAASARGALGWKVNGAGGEGGSLAVLCPPGAEARAAIEAAIAQASRDYQLLPTSIAQAGLEIRGRD